MRHQRRGWVWAGAAALFIPLVAACGQTSGGSGGAGATINIGVEGPMTGQYADVGAGFWDGAYAAAREINAEGGLLGGKLNVIQADDVSDPSDAIPVINNLIDVDHIVALDGPNSTVLPAIEPILDAAKIPTMFQGGSTHFDSNTDQWVWRPSPSDSQLGVAMAAYAISKGYKKAALLLISASSAQTLGGVIKSTYQKNGGTIVDTETIQPGETSYRSEVQSIISSQPDVIFTQVDAISAAPLFTDFAQLDNLAIPFIGSDLTAGSDFIKAITPAIAQKALVSIQGSTSAGPGTPPFVKYYDQVYSGAPVSGANYSYDAVMELAMAIEKAGSTDPAKIIAAIPEVSNPPGTDVSDWATALAAIKAGTKVHFVGAGGPAGYNSNHNSVGTFDAFQSDATGALSVIGTVTAPQMLAANNGTLGS
jgi:branched-chain amino acid transport system substrate-binding protein